MEAFHLESQMFNDLGTFPSGLPGYTIFKLEISALNRFKNCDN